MSKTSKERNPVSGRTCHKALRDTSTLYNIQRVTLTGHMTGHISLPQLWRSVLYFVAIKQELNLFITRDAFTIAGHWCNLYFDRRTSYPIVTTHKQWYAPYRSTLSKVTIGGTCTKQVAFKMSFE